MDSQILSAFSQELANNSSQLWGAFEKRAALSPLGRASKGLAAKLESVGKAAPWQGGLAAPIPKAQLLGEQNAAAVRNAASKMQTSQSIRFRG